MKETTNYDMYNLKCTGNQLRVIMVALESYFRVLMGQHFDLADEVALNGYVYNNEDPDNEKKFNEYINRRNDAQELYDKAYAVAAPNVWKRRKSPDMETAIDIWHVIRHQRYLERDEPKDHYTVDSYPPFKMSHDNDPLPTIERIEENETGILLN